MNPKRKRPKTYEASLCDSTITFRIPKGFKVDLIKQAEEEHRSMSNLLNRIIEIYLIGKS